MTKNKRTETNMNKKVLIFILATLTSNIVKRNLICSCLNPGYDTWIGSNAFSAATAVFLASYTTKTNDDGTPAIILYMYYTAMTLLVSILALRLVWVPVVDVVSELNMILSKTVLYVNKYMCTRTRNSCMKQVGLFLGTKRATIWSTNILGLVFLYAASTDILYFIGMYFYNLPKCGIFAVVRSKALKFINNILYMMSSKKCVKFHWAPEIKYYPNKTNKINVRKQYYHKSEYM